MLAHVVNKATSGTITPPANWTIIGAQSNTASSRSALFYKFADAADVAASTFTFTLGTSGRNRGEMGAWLGVNTTMPINVANQQINAAGTSIAVPIITVTDGCRVLVFGSNALGGVATACSGTNPACTIDYAVAYSTYCALACFSGIKSGTGAIDAHATSTYTSAVSSGHVVALTPAAAPEEHSGAALIHGNGTITPAVQKGGKGAAITSGGGTLAALAIAGMLGLAAISGGPGHLIATGQKAVPSAAIVSGGGSVTATGEKSVEQHSGAAILSGGGALASEGRKGAQDLAAISGNGSLIASGAKAASSIAAISGNGSTLGIGLKAAAGTAGPISANGSQIAEGKKAAFNGIVIAGGGSLIATGEGTGPEAYFGVASISGNGELIATGWAFFSIEEIRLLSRIVTEVDNLSQLATEVILISRLERGE